MKHLNHMHHLVLLILLITGVAGCSTDSTSFSQGECSKVYLDISDGLELQYQLYVPSAQDWAYYQTQVLFPTDSMQYAFYLDRNIYLNRPQEMIGDEVIDLDTYIVVCGMRSSDADTLLLVRFDGESKYAEYVLKGWHAFQVQGEQLIDRNNHLVTDAALPIGSLVVSGGDSIRIVKEDVFECYSVKHLTRKRDGVTITESWAGPYLITRTTPEREIRLSTIDREPFYVYLDKNCR